MNVHYHYELSAPNDKLFKSYIGCIGLHKDKRKHILRIGFFRAILNRVNILKKRAKFISTNNIYLEHFHSQLLLVH